MNIPPGYAQVNLMFSGTGYTRGAQVVFGVEVESPLVTPAGLATAVGGFWVETVLPDQTINITFDSVRVKFGPNDTGGDAVVGINEQGGNGSAPDSPQVAILVRKTAALGGRTNRGRMFVPGICEDQTFANGMLNPASQAVFQADFTAFLTSLSGSALPMVILHNSPELVPTGVVSLDVQSQVATQRRRLRKVGGRRRGGLNP